MKTSKASRPVTAFAGTVLLLGLLASCANTPPSTSLNAGADPPSAVAATPPVPQDLVKLLASDGVQVETASLADASQVEQSGISGDAATKFSVDEYGGAPEVHVFLVRVTNANAHPTDEPNALLISGALAYLVQMQGLAMEPMGGGSDPSKDDGATHSELDVFVDAMAGTELFSITVR